MMSVGLNVVKKRKKYENKPQLQLNKCLNEKRRREQENIYIEELAELISASISDMSSLSVKPDKCAILQETVNQIRRIKQESEPSDELQQSEVSSSKPTILANDVLGPILLEALDGFLFAVNTDGKIEYVSENVTSFLKYRQDDLVGTIIYNIIHVGDHGRFSSNLLPMSIGNGFSWSSDPNSGTNNKSRSFNCRFLIKPPEDETMEEKQSRVPQYENTQISAVSLPYSEQTDNSEGASELHNYLVCVARRIPPNERNSSSSIEQFTTRLDLTGKILAIDTSGVSSLYSKYLNKELVGRLVQELCHPSDLQKINQHLKESLQTGSNTSGIYRLRVAQEKYIYVQTKSKRFSSSQIGNEQEFIMATHSIIRDNDTPRVDNNPLVSQRTNISPVPSTSSNGPGLVSINGMVGTSMSNSVPVSTTSYANFHSLSPSSHELSLSELGLDMFPSSSWEMSVRENALADSLSTSLSTTQHSGVNSYTTVNSPNLPAISNSTSSTVGRMTIAQQQQMNRAFSPDIITGRGSQSHSPVAQLSSTSSPGPAVQQGGAAAVYGSSFPFSPVQQAHMVSGKSSPATTTLRKSEDVGGGYGTEAPSPVANLIPDCQARATQKLRDLLTQGMEEADSSVSKPSVGESDLPSSSASESESALAMKLSQSAISVSTASSSSSSRNENIILRELLNQEDEDGEFGGKALHRLSDNKGGMPSAVDSCRGDFMDSQKKGLANNNNNMLRKLLNNDDESDKNYRKTQDLLIHHLLKAESPEKVGVNPSSSGEPSANEVYVCSSVAKRKTPEDMADGSCDSAPKRVNANVHAQLAGQNPMLASMLAKTPPTLPSVPTSIANSIISQLPQDRLPKNLEKKLVHTPLPGGASSVNSALVMSGASVSQGGRTAPNLARSLLATQGSVTQQELVSNEIRTQVMQQQQQHPAVNSIPVTNGSYTQTLVQHQGFLSKILTTSEGSIQITRNMTTTASVSSSNSLPHQHAIQPAGSYGQFHQTVQNVPQTNASSTLNIPELVDAGQSLDSVGGPGMPMPMPTNDPELSEILDQVESMQQEMNIETVTFDETALLKFLDDEDVLEPQIPSPRTQHHPVTPQTPQDLNEKMAINAIQRHLMSIEGLPTNSGPTTTNVNTLPSYAQSGTGQQMVTSQSQLSPTSSLGGPYSSAGPPYQNVPQPPAYSSSLLPGQRPRLPAGVGIVPQQVIGLGALSRPGLLQYGGGSIPANVSPQMRRSLYERRQRIYLHQQQKRLLAQQQQQQLTMQTQQPMSEVLVQPGPGFPENMNDLLNNTVAPNVTLQRSSGLPEQQLSPRYGNNPMGQLTSPVGQPQQSQLSPGQRVAQQRSYSPLPQQSFQSPTPPAGSYQQQHRLSPHPLPSYPQPGQGPSPSPVTSTGAGDPRSPHMQLSPQPNSGQTQWNQRAPPSPASVNLQQQNPMLNAQLSQGAFAAQNRFAGPQRQLSVRQMPSPSSVAGQRNSPFATQPDSSFTPHSPGNVYSSPSAAKQNQQPPQTQQQQRLQRAMSVPVRVNSPRTSQAAFLTQESMLSPQSSPGYNQQAIPATIASSFSNSSAPIYSLAQENSHFSFEQQNLQMFPAQTSVSDRNRVAGGGVSSEYVRQELRAMVGARTQQQQQGQGQQQQVMHQMSLNSRPPSNQQQSSQSLDLEALGLGLQLDLVTGDDQMSASSLFQQPPLLSIASNQGSPLPTQQRSANSPRVDDGQTPGGQGRSLLQQLLSEPP